MKIFKFGGASVKDAEGVKNVLQVVIHKSFLSRATKTLLSQPSIKLNPWDSIAPALKIRNINPIRCTKR